MSTVGTARRIELCSRDFGGRDCLGGLIRARRTHFWAGEDAGLPGGCS